MKIIKTDKVANGIKEFFQRKAGSLRTRFSFHKRLTFYTLLGVVGSSILTALIIFPAQTSHAAAEPVWRDQALVDEIQGYAYRNAFMSCLDNKNAEISSSNASNGDWFGELDRKVAVSPFNDEDNAERECKENSFAPDALSSFENVPGASGGWGSNIEALCALGYVRANDNDGNCVAGNGDFEKGDDWSRDDTYRAIDNEFFGGSANFTDAMYYLLYARSMEIGCHASPIMLYDDATPDDLANLERDNYWWMYTVDSKGDGHQTIYQSADGFGRGREITLTTQPDSYGQNTEDCSTLAKRANDYVGAYETYMKQHQPGMNGVPGTCEERYVRKASEIEACQAGFAHKSEADYCYTAYHPDSVRESACEYGANTATGATGQTTLTPPSTDSNPGNGTSCAITGVGWIICPVTSFMAKIVDAAYEFVASLLTVQPLLTTGGSQGVYDAWIVMRNFANIAFVIAFLIIIFSQLTSVGITNYGIKKMLPRLVVAAILVNISYWICAIAVDLSNIAGSSLRGLFHNTAEGLPKPNATDFGATGTGWEGIAGGILATTAVAAAALYIGLAALLPALVAALLAIVTVFLVLTLRQALIILLVVISPLAFVAYLLPNTESLFNKWRGLLQTLLLMYPIIAAIFGASALASTIVMQSASGDYKLPIQIMGALVAILPLAITPVVMKSAGGVLNRFGGMINNPNKGPFDRMRKGAEGYRDYRQNVRKGNALSGKRTFGGGQFRRAARKDLRNNAAEATAKSGEAQFGVADPKARGYVNQMTQSQSQVSAINAANNSRFVNSVANGSNVSNGMGDAANDEFVRRALDSQQEKALADAIRDVEISAKIAPGDIDGMARMFSDAVSVGDTVTAQAMQNLMLTSGTSGVDKFRREAMAIDQTSPVADSLRENITKHHTSMKGTAADLDDWAHNGHENLQDSAKDASIWGGLSDERIVGQTPSALARAGASGGIDATRAAKILNDPRLNTRLKQSQKDQLEAIRTGAATASLEAAAHQENAKRDQDAA